MEEQLRAMRALAYYAYNYENDWIEKAFGQNEHLQAKWGATYHRVNTKGGSATQAFFDFYMDLTEDNKDKVNKVVLKYYENKRV